MQELNFRKGPHILLKVVNTSILSLNAVAALAATSVTVINLTGASATLPRLLEPYYLGPLAILNALFLVVMSIAYDRYYDLYTRAAETSLLGDLLDVLIKFTLLAGTFTLLAFPLWLVPIVALSYLSSNLRLRELKRSMTEGNPFHRYLTTFLLPNNTRHTKALILLALLWGVIHAGFVPDISEWLLAGVPDFDSDQRSAITAATSALYSGIFVAYWAVRMVVKQVVGPNPMLKTPGLSKIDKEISEYLASTED